jgi:hypothetical protein
MGHDRAKAMTHQRKRKGKASSSSQSEHDPSAVGDKLSTLKKISTSFAKLQLWKQWNKLNEHSTTNMDEDELMNHRLALKLIKKDLNFVEATAEEEEDMNEEDDEYNLLLCNFILTS